MNVNNYSEKISGLNLSTPQYKNDQNSIVIDKIKNEKLITNPLINKKIEQIKASKEDKKLKFSLDEALKIWDSLDQAHNKEEFKDTEPSVEKIKNDVNRLLPKKNDKINLDKSKPKHKLNTENKKIKLPEATQKIQMAKQTPLDETLKKFYLKRFGPYVDKELKQEAAQKFVNHLIDVGTSLSPAIASGVAKLDKSSKKKMALVQAYEKKISNAIPLIQPENSKNISIEKNINLKIHSKEKEAHQEHKFSVQISQNESGFWIASIKDKHDKKFAAFNSEKIGVTGYHEAAAWVHAQLDKKFYIESGLKSDLTDICKGLGITAETMVLLENFASDLLPRRGGGAVGIATSLISTVTDPLALQMVSTVGDIVGLSLIIPSILEAVKAGNLMKKTHKIDKKLDVIEKQLLSGKDELISSYKIFLNEFGEAGAQVPKIDYHSDFIDLQKNLEKKLENFTKNFYKTSKTQKKLEIRSGIEQLEKMINLSKECQKLNSQLIPIVTERNELVISSKTKMCVATANIISALSFGVKASIVMYHIANGLHLSASTAQACSALSCVGAPLFIASGLAQLVFDARDLDKKLHKKSALKSLINDLNNAKDQNGAALLSHEEKNLVEDLKKMEMRMINRKIVSNSMGMAGDVGLIAAGSVALASIILGATTLGTGAIAAPVVAGAAVGAKIAHDAIVKTIDNKQQKRLLKTQPENSDIGIIARLSMIVRNPNNEPGAHLIRDLVVNEYYGLDPELFIEITDGIVEKYHDLMIQSKSSETSDTSSRDDEISANVDSQVA